jgi:hypothetical protein
MAGYKVFDVPYQSQVTGPPDDQPIYDTAMGGTTAPEKQT